MIPSTAGRRPSSRRSRAARSGRSENPGRWSRGMDAGETTHWSPRERKSTGRRTAVPAASCPRWLAWP